MSFMEQTVEEYLSELYAGTLDELASTEGGYWESALSFVTENFNKKLSELSYRQRSWLIKIKTEAKESQ